MIGSWIYSVIGLLGKVCVGAAAAAAVREGSAPVVDSAPGCGQSKRLISLDKVDMGGISSGNG